MFCYVSPGLTQRFVTTIRHGRYRDGVQPKVGFEIAAVFDGSDNCPRHNSRTHRIYYLPFPQETDPGEIERRVQSLAEV